MQTASADELFYAKLRKREPGNANKADNFPRLKRAIENSGRDNAAVVATTISEPALDLFSELIRDTSARSDADSPERLTQHISKLLGDLQSQMLALQDNEAELNAQLRSQREVTDLQGLGLPSNASDSATLSVAAFPPAVRSEYEYVLRLPKSKRDQLVLERSLLAEEQVRWQHQQRDWSQRLQTLESQMAELKTQRQAVLKQRDNCRTLVAELTRDEARMAEREDPLRHEEPELALRLDELNHHQQALSTQVENSNTSASTSLKPAFATPVGTNHLAEISYASDEPISETQPSRQLQTRLLVEPFRPWGHFRLWIYFSAAVFRTNAQCFGRSYGFGETLEALFRAQYTPPPLVLADLVRDGVFMKFSLVDRIIALEAGKSITTVKNVSLAEEYLQDHFPGFPVLPGVMMVESLVQASAWLLRHTEDFRFSTITLKQAKALKFNNFVTPGKTLTVTSTIHKLEETECTFKGEGTVDGQSAVSARIVLQRINLRDRNPGLAKTDEMLVARLREQFAQIWNSPTA